jgi:general secretion pathway protein F
MMTASRFAYRAARADGTLEQGVLTANSRDDAARALTAQGLWAVSLRPARSLVTIGAGVPTADVALGLRVLSTLLDSGLAVSKALSAMSDLAPASWNQALPTMERAVREGEPLGTALERSGLVVPPVVLGIVQAGEAGSGLAAAVRRAAEMMEETAATQSAIKAALVYPAILAVSGTVSIAVLVGVVLPRFSAILADLGQSVPATTRFVLHASTLAKAAALPGVVVALLIMAVCRAWISTSDSAAKWHALLLRIPVLGGIRWSAASGQVCAALSALLESGVPISAALVHAARASGDAEITDRVNAAREAVMAGHRLSVAFTEHDALTPVVCRLSRAGEETGALAIMLAHAGRLEAQRATRKVRTAVQLLEPLLLIGFGAVVALVAAALLQAIYSVRPT